MDTYYSHTRPFFSETKGNLNPPPKKTNPPTAPTSRWRSQHSIRRRGNPNPERTVTAAGSGLAPGDGDDSPSPTSPKHSPENEPRRKQELWSDEAVDAYLVEGTVRGGGIREENFAAGFAGWVGSRRATSRCGWFLFGRKIGRR